MFMTFNMCNGEATMPEACQKLCLNLDEILSIYQTIYYVPAHSTITGTLSGILEIQPPHSTSSPGMRIYADRYGLTTKLGHQYTIWGDFDEITNLMSGFRSQRETI